MASSSQALSSNSHSALSQYNYTICNDCTQRLRTYDSSVSRIETHSQLRPLVCWSDYSIMMIPRLEAMNNAIDQNDVRTARLHLSTTSFDLWDVLHWFTIVTSTEELDIQWVKIFLEHIRLFWVEKRISSAPSIPVDEQIRLSLITAVIRNKTDEVQKTFEALEHKKFHFKLIAKVLADSAIQTTNETTKMLLKEFIIGIIKEYCTHLLSSGKTFAPHPASSSHARGLEPRAVSPPAKRIKLDRQQADSTEASHPLPSMNQPGSSKSLSLPIDFARGPEEPICRQAFFEACRLGNSPLVEVLLQHLECLELDSNPHAFFSNAAKTALDHGHDSIVATIIKSFPNVRYEHDRFLAVATNFNV